MTRIYFLSFFTCFMLLGESSLQKLNLLTIDNEKSIKAYQEHIEIQFKLRQALYQHQQLLAKGGKDVKVLEKNIPVLQKQLISVERQMHKLYGMVPGLTYGSKLIEADLILLCDDRFLRELFQKENTRVTPADIKGYKEEVDENGEVIRLNRVRLLTITKAKDLQLLQTMLDYGKDLSLHLNECREALSKVASAEREKELKKILKQLQEKRQEYEKNLESLYGVFHEDELELTPRRLEVFLYASLEELRSMALLESTQKRLIQTLK